MMYGPIEIVQDDFKIVHIFMLKNSDLFRATVKLFCFVSLLFVHFMHYINTLYIL